MSAPVMEGYTQIVPYDPNKILDTGDPRAFQMGVVEPGGLVANYAAWWYNMGYAFLYNGQLSLVVGGTVDTGADADTIDVMSLSASDLNRLLNGYPANASETALWLNPMPDPFRPFIDSFHCGITWAPPLGAATGEIRKCFQWDGSYDPDTWDFIYYPLGNGYCPDNAFLTDPFHSTISDATQLVEADVNCASGFRLSAHSDTNFVTGIVKHQHNAPGDLWYDSANNATGYVIIVSFKNAGTAGDGYNIVIDDGTYKWDMYIYHTNVASHLGFASPWSYVFDTTAAYYLYEIVVQGTAFELFVNGVSRATGILNVASTAKNFELLVSSGSTLPLYYLDYVKYYLNGTTVPLT